MLGAFTRNLIAAAIILLTSTICSFAQSGLSPAGQAWIDSIYARKAEGGVTSVRYVVNSPTNSASITGKVLYLSFAAENTSVSNAAYYGSNTAYAVSNWLAILQAQHTAVSNLAQAAYSVGGSGFWGVDGDTLAVSPLRQFLAISSGYWRVRSDGHLVIDNAVNPDTLWTTNGVGSIVLRRSVP